MERRIEMLFRGKRVKLLALVTVILFTLNVSNAQAACGIVMAEIAPMSWGHMVKPSSSNGTVVIDSGGGVTVTGLTEFGDRPHRGQYGVQTTGGGICHTNDMCIQVTPDMASVPTGHAVNSFRMYYKATTYNVGLGTEFCGLENPGAVGAYFWFYGTFQVNSTGSDTGGDADISFDVRWDFDTP